MVKKGYCHCGKPLHYSDWGIHYLVDSIIAERGGDQYIPVTVGKRTWLVQRHYIALHGLKAKELPRLGFEEIRL